ncbi:MAG: Gfo/Idh/MocA family oxidoreductase [Chitinophagaceae bacterium]|nr:Gfo/Idh/MocA family oxidoreductase [Chitinophagaceae bacterium]
MEKIPRRTFLSSASACGLGMYMLPAGLFLSTGSVAAGKRIGIIGLDTSQATMILSHINHITGPGYDVVQPALTDEFDGFKVVAAYPYGSRNIASSVKQIPFYIEKMKENNIAIASSIEELLQQTDMVMLMTFDGHPRTQQALQVMRAGKPLFINKPFAASLKEVARIIEYAKKSKVPVFSSSPTRYLMGAQAARKGEIGEVTGADCYSAAPLEPTHPDFFWYGIHGIEILFTILGKDCRTVQRTGNAGTDLVTGIWDNGVIGSYRGIRKGFATHSGTAFGTKAIIPAGAFNEVGHRPLVAEMLKFFQSGVSPVSLEETLAIHVFMEAADESKRNGGKPVQTDAVLQKALDQL